MKWIKNDNFIVDVQNGDIQAMLPRHEDNLRDKMIEVAPEMFASIFSFVEAMDSGRFAAKSAYNEFKQILERFPEDLIEGAKRQIA